MEKMWNRNLVFALFAGVSLCAMMASAAITQTAYYWTGGAGDNKWSSVGNWSMDEAGTTPATAYPGQNGFVKDVSYDSAYIPKTEPTELTLDVDVTLWRVNFSSEVKGSRPLTISGPGHTLNLVNVGNNSVDRTHVYRETHVRNITINANYWDSRSSTYFEDGAVVTVKNDLGLWSSNSKVFIEEGASVNAPIIGYLSTGAPLVTVNGGTWSGKLSTYSNEERQPPSLIVNGGTVTIAVNGNSKSPELPSEITVNGGTVVFDKLSLNGPSVFQMTGGNVSINNASSAQTRFVITGGELLDWMGNEPVAGDFCDLAVPPVGEVRSSFDRTRCAFVSTLTLPPNVVYRWGATSPIRKLKMGEGSKLLFEAGTGVLAVDEFDLASSASIEVTLPATLEDKVHPIVICGPRAEDITDRVVVTGDVPSGWTLCRDLKCIYLWKDSLWDPSALTYDNIWTGASPDGNEAQDGKNWKSGSVPAGGHVQVVYYGGRNLVITNATADSAYTEGKHAILAESGPSVLTGEEFKFLNYSWGYPASCNLNLHSPLPLTFRAMVKTGCQRAQLDCSGSSFIAFDGDFNSTGKKADIGLSGHIKFAGDTTIYRGLQLVAPDGSAAAKSTIAEVVHGANVVVKDQLQMNPSYPQLYAAKKCILLVEEDASLVYENGEGALYGWLDVGSTNRIYGKLDVQCPMTGRGTEAYFGTGELRIASTVATNGDCRVALGGGIRFSAGEFGTAGGDWPQYALKIDVVGEAVLEAPAAWRYAVPDDVSATSSAADRALTVAEGGVLTVASTNGFPIVFGEQIDGAGTLKFAPGAKLAFTPSMGIVPRAWTTVATVGAVEGLPVGDDIKFKVFDNDDGTQSLKCRCASGICILVR